MLEAIPKRTIIDMSSGITRSPLPGTGNYAAAKAAGGVGDTEKVDRQSGLWG